VVASTREVSAELGEPGSHRPHNGRPAVAAN
jgi:hypothetical protein